MFVMRDCLTMSRRDLFDPDSTYYLKSPFHQCPLKVGGEPRYTPAPPLAVLMQEPQDSTGSHNARVQEQASTVAGNRVSSTQTYAQVLRASTNQVQRRVLHADNSRQTRTQTASSGIANPCYSAPGAASSHKSSTNPRGYLPLDPDFGNEYEPLDPVTRL